MKSEMEQDLFKVLVTEEQLKAPHHRSWAAALYERFAWQESAVPGGV